MQGAKKIFHSGIGTKNVTGYTGTKLYNTNGRSNTTSGWGPDDDLGVTTGPDKLQAKLGGLDQGDAKLDT